MELLRQRRAEDEAARFNAADRLDGAALPGLGHGIDAAGEAAGIGQQGSDIAENDAWLGEVRYGADQGFDRRKGLVHASQITFQTKRAQTKPARLSGLSRRWRTNHPDRYLDPSMPGPRAPRPVAIELRAPPLRQPRGCPGTPSPPRNPWREAGQPRQSGTRR